MQDPPATRPYFQYPRAGTGPAEPPTAAMLEWVRRECGGATIIGMRSLPPGVGNVCWAITVGEKTGQREVVLRWSSRDLPGWVLTRVVRAEATALTVLEGRPVPAPSLIAADLTGDQAGVPCLLMSCLAGQPPAGEPDLLPQLAALAVAIHRVDATGADIPPFRLFFDMAEPAVAAGSSRPALWTRAFEATREAGVVGAPVFVHRDFHPGNTLWADGRLTGIVDWNSASIGPAGIDLGHTRWNLVVTLGVRAAQEFLEAYRSISGDSCADQPYWDVVMVLDLLGDTVFPPPQLERIESYLEEAVRRLEAGL